MSSMLQAKRNAIPLQLGKSGVLLSLLIIIEVLDESVDGHFKCVNII